MSFTVITTMNTKLTDPAQITSILEEIGNAPANITIKKKISGKDEIDPSGGTVTVDLTGFAPVKGIALSATNPLSVQLVGGANPAMTNVTDLSMRGEFTSFIMTNAGTEAAEVTWMAYGDPT